MEALHQFWSFIVSPPIMCAVIWYIVKTYFGKQEALLTKLTESMAAVNLKIAVHETRAAQVEESLKEMSRLKEQNTLMQAKIDAAWRNIEKMQQDLSSLRERAA
jgi:predicted phage-related endonuclease